MLSELAASVNRALVLIGTLYLIFAIVIAVILSLAMFFLIRMSVKFARFRGLRKVLCPETGTIAIIRIDALHAALSSAMDDPELQVSGCSRWPERQGCRQNQDSKNSLDHR